MSDWLDPIFERVDRSQRAGMRIGTLTAVNAGDASATVDLAGDVVPGVRWVGSYSPAVNDVVVVSRVDSMWIILGKLSKQLGSSGTAYGSLTLSPVLAWRGYFAEDYWSWSVVTSLPGGQGEHYPYSSYSEVNGVVWFMPGLPSVLPAGATVTSARLWLTRWTLDAEREVIDGEANLVTPRLYLHNYSAQPVADPSWLSAVWAPGTVTIGGAASWELPSTWLTQMLAGTALGVGAYSAAVGDWTRWVSVRLDVQYSIPT